MARSASLLPVCCSKQHGEVVVLQVCECVGGAGLRGRCQPSLLYKIGKWPVGSLNAIYALSSESRRLFINSSLISCDELIR